MSKRNILYEYKDLNISHRTRRIALCGILGALTLTLSSLENALPPIPVLPPGAKLGLSNIAVMYAAQSLGMVPALILAVIKGLFAGVTRGFTAMIMSLSGGFTSALVTSLLLRAKRKPFGPIGIGVAGALSHNAGQLCAAAVLTTPALFWYVPWLLLFGVATGAFTGICLRIVLPALERLRF